MKERLFKIVLLFGILLTSAEFISNLLHKSICSTEGCRIVAESVRFSDAVIVLVGLLVFLAIFLLSLCKKEVCQKLIDALLITALSAEGVFVGYQLFRVKTICIFCITVFLTFVVLTLIRSIERRFVLTGFLTFVSVLFVMFMLKPAGTNNVSFSATYTIIYKEGCPHCEKVMKEAEEKGVKLEKLNAQKCISFLKSLNIKEVPVLVVNKKAEKIIVIGDKNIEDFLFKGNEEENTTIEENSLSGFCPIDSDITNCTDDAK
ncbi:hypothetical protein SAMN06265339_0963 [Desulfurobacterium pacificum]|uniref:Glutaredoxin domain-containing protein n=1 Tax=Desulfurobacterium pacificum TaxID=240166 RepID=A0ABY1NKP4_9BACT|nr:hypothetical protein [Desulfurobacterium pacificum]SMP11757.1 hypothetical protein SAMN06265339_0963 [Desulfurobacterium pacificum]